MQQRTRGNEALGIERCSTWLSGKVGSGCSLSLASFTSHRRALSWARGAVTLSPHSDVARFTRLCRLVVLGQPPASRRLGREGLCSSFTPPVKPGSSHRLLLERSVAAALPAGPFARRHHAARDKFLVQSVSNPRAKSLNSVGKVA